MSTSLSLHLWPLLLTYPEQMEQGWLAVMSGLRSLEGRDPQLPSASDEPLLPLLR